MLKRASDDGRVSRLDRTELAKYGATITSTGSDHECLADEDSVQMDRAAAKDLM